MKESIKRGATLIGTVTYSNEASALGSEASATTPFPGEWDSTEQCESYDSAVNFLHRAYELHCAAQGITPEPRPEPAPELSAEEAHYAQLAAEQEAELAYHNAQLAAEEDRYAAVREAENATLDGFRAAREEIERDLGHDDAPDSDDLPF
jgi:hypothetical protein